VIEYCPHCGATKFIQYRHGDQLMCKTCGKVSDRRGLMRTRIAAELPRLIVASCYLARLQGDFTRSELAAHLGMGNGPYFRAAVDDLVSRKLLIRAAGQHPQNHKLAWFYRRPGPAWVRYPVDRPCWAAGAAR